MIISSSFERVGLDLVVRELLIPFFSLLLNKDLIKMSMSIVRLKLLDEFEPWFHAQETLKYLTEYAPDSRKKSPWNSQQT